MAKPRKPTEPPVDYETLLAGCIEARTRFEQSQAAFYLYLCNIEQTHMREITLAGCRDFLMFLRRHELCDLRSYSMFREGLRHVTTDEALALGAPAVQALAKLVNVESLPKYIEAIGAWSQENHGLTPREQTVSRILRQVDPREETPRAVSRLGQRVSELARVKAELQEARVKLRIAETRIRELEKIVGGPPNSPKGRAVRDRRRATAPTA